MVRRRVKNSSACQGEGIKPTQRCGGSCLGAAQKKAFRPVPDLKAALEEDVRLSVLKFSSVLSLLPWS